MVVDPTNAFNTSDHSDSRICAEHVVELEKSAIPLQVALDEGVYSAHAESDLPAWSAWIADVHGDDVFPALVYPMKQPDGSDTGQVKPAAGSVRSRDGDVLKYISPDKASTPPKLVVVREVDSPACLVIVEGVKQALATKAWAPDDWSIYRICGIWGWQVAGDDGQPSSPTPLLSVVLGHDVVIIPDADAQTNIRVFDGATALGNACTSFGAQSTKFVRLPAGGKQGVDDLLAFQPEDKRPDLLKSWVAGAKAKPADLTKAEQSSMRSALRSNVGDRPIAREDGRVAVRMDADVREVSLRLVNSLIEGSGGQRLFSQGGLIVRVQRSKSLDSTEGKGPLQASDLKVHELHREILDVAFPYVCTENGGEESVKVDLAMLGIVSDHADKFPRLNGISRSPVVRMDGTLVLENGYDPATGMILDLSEDLTGLTVPEHPTDDDITDARTLVRDVYLARDGDDGYDGWVFKSTADQTIAVAGLITPIVRPMTGPAPAIIYNGLTPGCGKGGLMNSSHQIVFGEDVSYFQATTDEREMGLLTRSAIMAGTTIMAFDDIEPIDGGPCRLNSQSFATTLTANSVDGRVLGESRTEKVPQRVTFYGLGNNVVLSEDMARRAVHCQLHSDRKDIATRSNFRFDLSTWVPEHRLALLRAVLVIVRAWFDRGQPEAPRPFGFASFEGWQRIVGGILHLAGFEDFLANTLETRQTDLQVTDTIEHLEWVATVLGVGVKFKAKDVRIHAKTDQDAAAPYGKNWDELDARLLSRAWGAISDRWFGDYRIREAGTAHGGGKAWVIEYDNSTNTTPTAPSTTEPDDGSAALGELPEAPEPETIETTDRNGLASSVPRVYPSLDGETISELKR